MELFKLLGTIAIDNTEANTAIDDTSNKAKNAEGNTKKSFGGIGKAAGTLAKGMVGVGAAVGGAFIGAVESTREYRTQMGMLETAFSQVGLSTESAKNTYTELNAVLGDSGQAVEASQHLALIADNEEELAGLTNSLTGVYATFGESLPLEGLAEGINHSASLGEVQGSLADALEWSGISVESFNGQLAKCANEQERQALITNTLNDLYGEAGTKYKEVNKDVLDAEKAHTRMTDAMARVGAVGEPIMTLLKNGFASMLEAVLPFAEALVKKIPSAMNQVQGAFDKVLPYLKQAWQVLWVVLQTVWNTVGKPVFNFVMQMVNQLVAFFRKNWPAIANVIRDVFNTIKSLWNSVLKPVLTILGNYIKNTLLPIWKSVFNGIMKVVQTSFNGIIKLWNGSLKPILNGIIQFVSGVLSGNWKKAWNGIKSVVSGVFSGIKTVISTAISVIKTTFSSGLSVVKTIVSTTFENVKKTISSKLEGARKTVKSVIDKIKGFFPLKIGKIFSNLKIPKISVSGGKAPFGIAGKGKLPSFDVKWNAEGAILDEPTIFGRVGNTLLGGGEAGMEAVTPIDVLQEYVRQSVRAENGQIINVLIEQNQILMDFLARNMPKEVLLDSGALVGELADPINKRLGTIYNRNIRGNTI